MSCPDTSSFWDLKMCGPNFKIFTLQPPLPCWRVLKLKSAHPTHTGTMPHPIIYSRHQLLALHANSGLLHGRDVSGQSALLGGHIPDRSFHLSSWGPYDPPSWRKKKISAAVCRVMVNNGKSDVITKLNGFQMTQQSKVVREKQRDWLCFSTEDGGTWDTSLFGSSSASRAMN